MSSPSSSPSGTPAGASPPSNSTTITSTPAPLPATPSSTSASPASSLSPPPVYSPPPVSASAPSPSSPSTTTSPPPPPSSLVVSPPPPKSVTPSSSTSPPPPPISASPPPPAAKSSPTSTSSSSSSSSSSSISGSTLAAIGVAAVLAISVIAVLLYCLCKKKKKKQYYQGDHHGPPGAPPAHYKDPYNFPNTRQQELFSPSSYGSDIQFKMPPPPPVPPSLPSPGNGYDSIPLAPNSDGTRYPGNSKSWFTYEQLATATDGFSRSNMLGEGGFGCVYKGVLSDGGQLVAVKQLKVGASQGEKEFQAEVEIISRVHHRHLVSLVGYCIAGSQRLLVYDYVPNGTLEYHLHNRKGGPVMDWATRIKIACGAARGLAYLHEDCHPRIIHRDIKSSNILLDNNFEAQVSDFGLAKLSSDTNTHVTTRVMGTFGYLAPEYASSGKLTEKSDVFSFGVVLLELLTGQKPVDPSRPLGEESLVEWARPVLAQVNSEEDLKMVADPSLNGAYDPKEMMQMVEAAAACVRHSANKRPRMGQVVRALEDETSLSDLNKGLKPGHSSVYGSSFTSSDYDNGSYSADMRRFRRVALGSQEYGSEYSGATSESGVNPSTSNSDYQTSREIDRNLSRLTKPVSVRTNIQASSSNEFSTSN